MPRVGAHKISKNARSPTRVEKGCALSVSWTSAAQVEVPRHHDRLCCASSRGRTSSQTVRQPKVPRLSQRSRASNGGNARFLGRRELYRPASREGLIVAPPSKKRATKATVNFIRCCCLPRSKDIAGTVETHGEASWRSIIPRVSSLEAQHAACGIGALGLGVIFDGTRVRTGYAAARLAVDVAM